MTEQERERERLARWLRNGETYDDWAYGTEPIPKDRSWAQKKPLEGAEGNEEDERAETIAPLP